MSRTNRDVTVIGMADQTGETVHWARSRYDGMWHAFSPADMTDPTQSFPASIREHPCPVRSPESGELCPECVQTLQSALPGARSRRKGASESRADVPPVVPEAEAFDTAVGAALWQARRRRKWSRGRLITESGVDISVDILGAYEHGTLSMGVHRLFRICKALGIEPVAVLNGACRATLGTA